MDTINLNRNEFVNLLRYINYPEIRQLCLTNKNYANICKEYKQIINDKLETYVDKIINDLPLKIGFHYKYTEHIRHYENPEPKPQQSNLIYGYTDPIGSDYVNETKFIFGYKEDNLKTLLLNHEFHLIYDCEYVYPRSPGIYIMGEKTKKGKYILTETINELVFALDRIYPKHNKNITTFKSEGENLRDILKMLLTYGFIG